VLQQVGHYGDVVVMYFMVPSPTSSTTAGFTAFRFSSKLMVPVTPGKSLVCAIALRTVGPERSGARCMAAIATRAES